MAVSPRGHTSKDTGRLETMDISKSSEKQLQFRLWFYGLCSVHFVVLGLALLCIDYESYGDERIVVYRSLRFKFLTIWINAMHLIYFPLCLALTWTEYKGRHFSKNFQALERFRHFWFTAIIFPVTLFICTVFWRVWLTDREAIVPRYCDRFLPLWAQHGLHTNTIMFCVLELLTVPRSRPRSTKLHRRALNMLLLAYFATLVVSYHTDGVWVYPFLKTTSWYRKTLLAACSMLLHQLCFDAQWILVDLVRTRRFNLTFGKRWNNHQPNFISVFTTLLNTESLVDVTLAAEGKHLQAHKVVLSACSVYFQSLFTAHPSRHPIVIIKDVGYADLRVLVDFMYYGEVNVTEDQLPRILDTARLLKIKGLTEMPDSTRHGSPGDGATEPGSPERRGACGAAGKEPEELGGGGGGGQWEQAAGSPASRDAQLKRKRRKTSDEPAAAPPPEQHTKDLSAEAAAACAAEAGRAALLQNCLPQQNGLYQLPEITGVYTGVLTHRTESEDNSLRTSQHTYVDQNTAYNHQAMPWVNHGYVHTAEGFADRQEGVNFAPVSASDYSEAMPASAAPAPSDIPLDMQTQGEVASQRPVETPGKRRRTSNPQAAENFQRAIEAVRFGGIGFCKAARIFGVNNRTLWLEYKKKGYPNHRPSIRERIKREPAEPQADAAEPAAVEEVREVADAPQQPIGYMMNQTCFQYLQDNSLQGF